MPSTKFEDVHERALWNPVNDQIVQAVVPGSIVHELTWNASENATQKWRAFLDPETLLPMRTENRTKDRPEEQFVHSSSMVFTYIDQEEIEEVIQKWFTE